MILFLATFLAALSLSLAAAYYSIIGLVSIFSGSVLAITIMASSMEFAKIVTAIWLHANWDKPIGILKYYLSASVVVLMLITSMGIYGFLSKSHLESTTGVGQNKVELQFIQKQIEQVDTEISRNENVIAQLDASIDTLIQANRVTNALRQREAQRNERALIESNLNSLRQKRSELLTSQNEIEMKVANIEVEVGPIRYISELIYGESSENKLEDAVRWVIIMLIFVFDPLAILLMIAAQLSYKYWRESKLLVKNPDEAANFEQAIPEIKS